MGYVNIINEPMGRVSQKLSDNIMSLYDVTVVIYAASRNHNEQLSDTVMHYHFAHSGRVPTCPFFPKLFLLLRLKIYVLPDVSAQRRGTHCLLAQLKDSTLCNMIRRICLVKSFIFTFIEFLH